MDPLDPFDPQCIAYGTKYISCDAWEIDTPAVGASNCAQCGPPMSLLVIKRIQFTCTLANGFHGQKSIGLSLSLSLNIQSFAGKCMTLGE